MFAKNSVKT